LFWTKKARMSAVATGFGGKQWITFSSSAELMDERLSVVFRQASVDDA
jgi:hypothetical protein